MKSQIRSIFMILIVALTLTCMARAQTTAPSRAKIAISATTEDNQKMIRALVTVDGKPVENATVNFYIGRTFGNLSLGQDKTLDDGSAAVKFPVNLPGDAEGSLCVLAEIKDPPQYVSQAQALVAGGTPRGTQAVVFPRALWSRHAPLPLLITIGTLIGGVWTTYAFVITQVLAIRKGDKS